MAISLPRPDKFYQRMHRLADRMELGIPYTQTSEALPRFRKYLKEVDRLIFRYHRTGGSGLRVVNCRSIAIDVMVTRLYEHACRITSAEIGRPLTPFSLLALGGYGRLELCPLSDVDLMFLYPVKSKDPEFPKIQAKINDAILYMLWDLNLKVGHSTRTIKEAIAEANADVQSKNAMMESRLICGDDSLYDKFQKEYSRFIKKDNTLLYLKERLADQQKRRDRMGNTVFLQEPDVKNGVGGLRDYHNILWMARLKYNTNELGDLVKKNLLRKKEHDDLLGAYDFLLRSRNEVHFQSKRPTDVLNIEKQPKIAWGMRYRQRDIFLRVETYMRDYYRATYKIFHLSSYLEMRLSIDSDNHLSFAAVIESRRHFRTEIFDGFSVMQNVLSAQSPKVFQQDPVRLIRVFRHLQARNLKLDFDLERTIEENLDLIDDSVINSADANRSFRSILQSKGDVYPTLTLMNRTGVLSRFIPEWAALHCLVQHEYYHRYTADEHTLNTIRQLDLIFSGSDSSLTKKYRDAIGDTSLPALLYVILLLHDIGKGSSIENHAEEGARIATEIIKRLGIVEKAQEIIIFLIKNHLEMARIWQRFDVDDPQTSQAFAEQIRNSENLRYLYVLTFCDARGTTHDLWNSFKDTLHLQLFTATMRSFSTAPMAISNRESISRDEIQNALPDVSADEVEAHFNLLPERYFSYHSHDEVILHIKMIHQLLENIASADSLGSLVPVVEWQDDLNLGLTTVHIVTWDRAGLFYKLAGAFALAGLSIVSSKALSRADHITIDTFYVCQPDGGVVEDVNKLEIFQMHLNEALLHNRDLMEPIKQQAAKFKRPSLLQVDTQLPAALPPKVEIYHELSLKRTIIEIETNDELGLLYKVSHAIYKHGFDISFARISTEKNVAVDTFYIEPIQPSGSSDSSALIQLREKLLEIVRESSTDPNQI